jgi:hypothetical protein
MRLKIFIIILIGILFVGLIFFGVLAMLAGIPAVLQSDINLLNQEIERLNKLDFIKYNPSLEEVKEIIALDKTEQIPYTDDFTCIDFSHSLISVFRQKGIYSCIAYLEMGELAHAVVALNSTEGLIFIEPQTDQIIKKLSVGDNYCEKVDWYCYWELTGIKHCFQ